MISRRPSHDPTIDISAETWQLCDEVARTHGKTFYLASRFLPPARRRAIRATYAFCRTADDIVDQASATGLAAAVQAADDWEEQLENPTAPIARAFAAVRERYDVPVTAAHDLLAGVRSDLAPHPYATWEELRLYCYLVAGTVGLLVAPILGCQDETALPHAVNLGIAMQLTNILRDVAEDARIGRLYLPLADLAAFDCDPASVLAGKPDGRFSELLAYEIARARTLYADGKLGLPALSPSGRLATLASSDLYAKILARIEEQQYDVFSTRAAVPTQRKLRALPGVAATFVRLSLLPARFSG